MNQKLFELIYVMIVRQELKPQDAYEMLRDFFRLTEISEREKVNEQKPEVHQWEPLDLSKWPCRIIDNPQSPYLGTWTGGTGDITYSKSSNGCIVNASTSPAITCTCSAANAATTACVSSVDSSIEADLASETGPFGSSSSSSFQTVPATETAPTD